MNRATRLARIEQSLAPSRTVFVWQHNHETMEEALSRPGDPGPGVQVVLVRWLRGDDHA